MLYADATCLLEESRKTVGNVGSKMLGELVDIVVRSGGQGNMVNIFR